MLYRRGDRALVEGFGGKQAVLRVWEVRERGLILCTEGEYDNAISNGEIVTALGFPMGDVREHTESNELTATP
jgi:hypothetical protein